MSLMALARKIVPYQRTNASRRSFDAAVAVSRSQLTQSGTSICDFPIGAPCGFAVIAESGLQNRLGGTVSRIIATEVFSDLKFYLREHELLEEAFEQKLQDAVKSAFKCVEAYISEIGASYNAETSLVVPMMFQDRLYWSCIGAQALFLLRDGKIDILNRESIDNHLGEASESRNAGANASVRLPKIFTTKNPTWIESGDIVFTITAQSDVTDPKEFMALSAKGALDSSEELASLLVRETEFKAEDQAKGVSALVLKLGSATAEGEIVR